MVAENDKEDESLPVHQKILELSATRWTVRAQRFRRMLENYPALQKLFDSLPDRGGLNSEIKVLIIGVLSQINKFECFCGLFSVNGCTEC